MATGDLSRDPSGPLRTGGLCPPPRARPVEQVPVRTPAVRPCPDVLFRGDRAQGMDRRGQPWFSSRFWSLGAIPVMSPAAVLPAAAVGGCGALRVSGGQPAGPEATGPLTCSPSYARKPPPQGHTGPAGRQRWTQAVRREWGRLGIREALEPRDVLWRPDKDTPRSRGSSSLLHR